MDWPGTLNLCSLRDSDQESNTQTKDKLKSRLLSLLQSREYSLYDSRGKPLQVLPTPQPLAESQELNPVQTENTLKLNKQKLGQLLNKKYKALLAPVARNLKRSGPVLSNSDKSSLDALSQQYGPRKLYHALIPPPTSPVDDVAAEVDRDGTNLVVDSHSSVGTIETPVTGDQHSDPRMSQRGFAAATPVSSTTKGETNFGEDAFVSSESDSEKDTLHSPPLVSISKSDSFPTRRLPNTGLSGDMTGIEKHLDFRECTDKGPLVETANMHSSSSSPLVIDIDRDLGRTDAKAPNTDMEVFVEEHLDFPECIDKHSFTESASTHSSSPNCGQEDLARTIAGTPSTDTEGLIERLDFTECIDKHPLEASASTHSSSPQLEYDQEDLDTRTSAGTANTERGGYKALCDQDLDTRTSAETPNTDRKALIEEHPDFMKGAQNDTRAEKARRLVLSPPSFFIKSDQDVDTNMESFTKIINQEARETLSSKTSDPDSSSKHESYPSFKTESNSTYMKNVGTVSSADDDIIDITVDSPQSAEVYIISTDESAIEKPEPKVSKLETNEDDVIDMPLVNGKMRASESEQLRGHATGREETASDGDMEESPANIAHNISPDKVLAAKRLLATGEGHRAQNRFADRVGIPTTCCDVSKSRYVYVGPNLNVCLSGKVDILQGNYLFEVKHSFIKSTEKLGRAELRECLFYMVICQLDCAFFVVENSKKIFVAHYDEGDFQEIVKQAKELEAESLRQSVANSGNNVTA
jgi:hypothetical protein